MDKNTKVSVIMGSSSDWPTMKEACELLGSYGIPYEKKVVSAHRTPDLMYSYAKSIEASEVEVIIAGAGGAAHLPGMVASMVTIPVIGVPIQSKALKGLDSLLSIVQMPASTPVATMAIGTAGAKNAAWLAMRILGTHSPEIREKVKKAKQELASEVEKSCLES